MQDKIALYCLCVFLQFFAFFPNTAVSQELIQILNDGWERLNSMNFDGIYTIEETNNDIEEPIHRTRIVKTYQNYVAVEVLTHSDSSQFVGGFNPEYSFRLNRNNDNFVIDRLDEFVPEHEQIQIFQGLLEKQRRHPSFYFFKNLTWSYVVNSAGFKILNSREIEINNQTAMAIEFECFPKPEEHQPRHGHEAIPQLRNGRATFLIDLNYVPKEWEFEIKYFREDDFSPIKIVVEYDPGSSDKLIPKLRTRTRTVKGNTDVETWEYQFEAYHEKPNLDQFRLTGYGLPEPPFAKTRAVPFIVWLLLVGLVLFAGGMFFLRKSEQTK